MAEPTITGRLRITADGKLIVANEHSLITDDDPDQDCCCFDPDCQGHDTETWQDPQDWTVTVSGAFRKICPTLAVFLATKTGNINVRITLSNVTLVCNYFLYARVNDVAVAFGNGQNPWETSRFPADPHYIGGAGFQDSTVAVNAGDTLVLHGDYCIVEDNREPLVEGNPAGCGGGCWGPWISAVLHADVITHVHGLTGIYTHGTLYDGAIPVYPEDDPDRCEWWSGYKGDEGNIAGDVPATLVDGHGCAVFDRITRSLGVYRLERFVSPDGLGDTLVWFGTLNNKMCDPRGVYTRVSGTDTTTANVTVS